MHRKRPSTSAVAVLAIPLLLCPPNTLVAAFGVYDYITSSLGSAGTRSGGGSLVRRDELSEYGFYNPLDYGGYMLTVSFPLLFSLALPPFSGGLFLVFFSGYGYLAFRDSVGFDD